MDHIQLRTYALVENMQPQYAASTGTVVKGDPCLAGMAQLYIEMVPGSEVFRLLDVALKNSSAKPGFLVVEREYGEIELHSMHIDDVMEAGRSILDLTKLSLADRIKPSIVSVQIVQNVDPYQAQLINRGRYGSLLLPGEHLLIMEVEPAAYISIAVNEAEKHARIKLVSFDPVGKYGRMYLSADDISEIRIAEQAAIEAIESISGTRS
ncbi:MAG TPA: hypothetical protein PLU04_10185 [Anaerolineaceae bacterium]|nr:hypothetical protein [Anaerolineaceae bacterium]